MNQDTCKKSKESNVHYQAWLPSYLKLKAVSKRTTHIDVHANIPLMLYAMVVAIILVTCVAAELTSASVCECFVEQVGPIASCLNAAGAFNLLTMTSFLNTGQ